MLPAGPLALALALGAVCTASAAPGQALAPCSRIDRPIVAEVFYDATGDDTGHEFVELWNPGGAPASLAGLRLEAGDGAGPSRWTLRWTGGAADSIAARGRFVIGGALVEPPPDAQVSLDLQNGPDAVRLAWPDGVTEVVGYGTQAFAEYACGEPAADVPSGQSLARVPDASNRGANALDFRAWPPSPGRENLPDRDVALIPGTLALDPEQPAPDQGARLSGRVANRGATPLAAGEVTVIGAVASASGEDALFSHAIPVAIAAGDSAAFEVATRPLATGKRTLRVRLALAGDGSSADDRDSLRVRVGPGPLEITEIQFHPASGEAEWVEVRNRDAVSVDPADFTLADRGSARGVPDGGGGALAPESLAVLAQDRGALLARHPALDPGRIWEVSPWSALNNSDDSTGIADAVVLRESDGTPCERVSYSAGGVPAGVPIERRPGGWGPSSDPLGTPLSPPRALAPIAGRFQVTPRRVRAGVASARLAWSLPWPRARVAVEVYDLAGRRVLRALPETASTARGEREWHVEGLSPGLYLVALVARAEDGDGSLRETCAIRIEGAAP
ncbi:MAG TPA: hypothetical protein VGK89_04110 [Candidatus Eisenbacteria bacterium]|jgi:hypothetical protein